VVQRRENSRFPLEASEPLRIACERTRKNLDRYVAAELGIAGAIHLAHASGPDEAADLIDAEPRSLRERHERSILAPPDAIRIEAPRWGREPQRAAREEPETIPMRARAEVVVA
jgi:hypothetical protein